MAGGTKATPQPTTPTDFGMVQGKKKTRITQNPLAGSMPKRNRVGDPLRGKASVQDIARAKPGSK